MYVIGTAGHVDHGKSSLIEALTGIDPDRLKEEKDREMTIDLGFAWMKVGNGEDEVGIIDVPGHRDFIENMLAGVGGIDLALLVIAADEGVMPQTKEHLAIIDLLEIKGGVVALTKVDLVEDDDWLELVTLEITEALANSVLAEAPIVPVSAHARTGLEQLTNALDSALESIPARVDIGQPRLPIDRVFSLPGFGTIVTGTLIDGQLRPGDWIEVMPSGKKARIRGLQTHRSKREVAFPGSRVAVNLTGMDRDEIRRGDVLASPGTIQDTVLCDVSYRHLVDASTPLKHNVEVKLFVGAAETLARVRVIGSPQIDPGSHGWLQLVLEDPVALMRGDRFILRRPSPAATIGGGRILDPHPGRKHRRFRPEVVKQLKTISQGSPAEVMLQTVARLEPDTAKEVIRRSGLSPDTAQEVLQELIEAAQVRVLGKVLVLHSTFTRFGQNVVEAVDDFHRQNPLRKGMPREELRSRLRITPPIFNALIAYLAAENRVVEQDSIVSAPGHAIRFSDEQRQAIKRLESQFASSGVNSPSVKEARAVVGTEVYAALLELGQLRQISKDVVYRAEDYDKLVSLVEQHLQENGRIDAAQVRDKFVTSRKYAIALLEHLDEIRLTRRVGDERQLF